MLLVNCLKAVLIPFSTYSLFILKKSSRTEVLPCLTGNYFHLCNFFLPLELLFFNLFFLYFYFRFMLSIIPFSNLSKDKEDTYLQLIDNLSIDYFTQELLLLVRSTKLFFRSQTIKFIIKFSEQSTARNYPRKHKKKTSNCCPNFSLFLRTFSANLKIWVQIIQSTIKYLKNWLILFVWVIKNCLVSTWMKPLLCKLYLN
jgi:hypothetical protein